MSDDETPRPTLAPSPTPSQTIVPPEPDRLGPGDLTALRPEWILMDSGRLGKSRAPRTDRIAGLAARMAQTAQTAQIVLEVGETHGDQLVPVLAVAGAAQLSGDPVVAGLGRQLSDLLASIEEGPLTADDRQRLLEVLGELAPLVHGDSVPSVPTVAVHEQWLTPSRAQTLDTNARLSRRQGAAFVDAPIVPGRGDASPGATRSDVEGQQ